MENKPYELTDSVEALEAAIARVRAAQRQYATFTQEQVDRIFLAAATAADQARIPLAKMAVAFVASGVGVEVQLHSSPPSVVRAYDVRLNASG